MSHASVDEVLVSASHLLIDLAHKMNQAEISLSKSILNNEDLSHIDTKSIQNIDFVRQSLCDISELLTALSHVSEVKDLDTSKIKMQITKSILTKMNDEDQTPAGEFDLF